MFLIDMALIVFQFMIYKAIFGRLVNYVSINNLIWLLMIGLSRLNLFGFYSIGSKTYFYVYFMLAVFNLSSICFLTSANGNKINKNESETSKISKKDIEIEKPNYYLLFGALFSLVSLSKYVPSALRLFAAGGFDVIRKTYLRGGSDELKFGTNIIWFVNALIMATIIMSFTALMHSPKGRIKKTTVITFIISCVNAVLYALITGGRFLFVMCLLAICIELYINSKGRLSRIIKKHKKISLLIAAAVILVFVISSQRRLGDVSVFENIYVYFYASINMFDVMIKSPISSRLGDYLYGTYLIAGITSPFIVIINSIFGAHIKLPLAVINQVTSVFVSISPSMNMNNNCTFIYGALRDFGFLGIIIYTVIWSGMLYSSYKAAMNKQTVLSESIYVYILVVSVLLLFEWMFGRVNIMWCMFFMYLFHKANRLSLRIKIK